MSAVQPFDTPCERCGNFAPLSYKHGPGLCSDCLERWVHPIAKDAPTVGALLQGVGTLMWRIGPISALLLIAIDAPVTLASYFLPEQLTYPLLLGGVVASAVGNGVVVHLAWQVIAKKPKLDIGEAFRAVGRRFGPLVATQFLSNLLIGFLTLLLIVPGIVGYLWLMVALPICLHESTDSGAAMRQSSERMKPLSWSALGALAVLVVPALLALSIAGCLVPGAVLLATTSATNGGPSTETIDWVAGAVMLILPGFWTPMRLLSAVLYAKVERSSALR